MRRILLGALLALLGAAGAAYALEIGAGDLLISADAGFKPRALPRSHDAPITLHGGGKLSTVSGALPPIMSTLNFEFDRHGSVQTTGLPVCTKGKLIATDVPAARRACPGAIVGKGFARVVVKFPEQGPIPVSTPLTLFNGPRRHGLDTLFVHAYLDIPVPAAIVIPMAIEKIHNGVYGYRVEVKIPPLAGGYGIPVSGSMQIGRRWTHSGKRYSFVNARCETGHLQARVEFGFKDGTVLFATFFRPCSATS